MCPCLVSSTHSSALKAMSPGQWAYARKMPPHPPISRAASGQYPAGHSPSTSTPPTPTDPPAPVTMLPPPAPGQSTPAATIDVQHSRSHFLKRKRHAPATPLEPTASYMPPPPVSTPSPVPPPPLEVSLICFWANC